jgi:hypothetical protein
MKLLSSNIVSEFRVDFTYQLNDNLALSVQTYERYQKDTYDITINDKANQMTWETLTMFFGEKYISDFKALVTKDVINMADAIKAHVRNERALSRGASYDICKSVIKMNSPEILDVMSNYPETTLKIQSRDEYILAGSHNPNIELTYKNESASIEWAAREGRFVVELNYKTRRYKSFESLVKKFIDFVDAQIAMETEEKNRIQAKKDLHAKRVAVLKANFADEDLYFTERYDSNIAGKRNMYYIKGHTFMFEYSTTEIKSFATFAVKDFAMIKQILAIVKNG